MINNSLRTNEKRHMSLTNRAVTNPAPDEVVLSLVICSKSLSKME